MAGLILGVLAALLLMVGAWATLAPGGNEPEPVRVVGITMLLLGTLIGLGAVLALRSKK